MKNIIRRIQEFFIHLFGGVTKMEAREKLFELETKCSSQYDELCDELAKVRKELEQTKEEFEKYKKGNTIFSVQYMDEPLTVEYTQVCSKDRLPDENILDNIMKDNLIELMTKSNEFKQCIKIIKKYNPVDNTNIYKGVARIVNLNKEIYAKC